MYKRLGTRVTHTFTTSYSEVVSDILGHTYSCGNIATITDVCTHVCPFVMTPSINVLEGDAFHTYI